VNRPDLLDDVRSLVADHGPRLQAQGCSVKLSESPEGRNPRSVTVILDSDRKLAQLSVWRHGLADLSIADVASGEIVESHHEVSSREDVMAVFQLLISWTRQSLSE
jgi:hypothetical protein